jgi:hypothetical protein
VSFFKHLISIFLSFFANHGLVLRKEREQTIFLDILEHVLLYGVAKKHEKLVAISLRSCHELTKSVWVSLAVLTNFVVKVPNITSQPPKGRVQRYW